MAPLVAPVSPEQHDRWRDLFAAYRSVAGMAPDPAVLDEVWSWIQAPRSPIRCLVATVGPDLVGLAHVRVFPRPVTGTTGLWLDDLYVDPAARGRGVARALIGRVRASAADEGHDVVRWTTRTTNLAARRLYDTVAVPAGVVVYDATPAPLEPGETPHR